MQTTSMRCFNRLDIGQCCQALTNMQPLGEAGFNRLDIGQCCQELKSSAALKNALVSIDSISVSAAKSTPSFLPTISKSYGMSFGNIPNLKNKIANST